MRHYMWERMDDAISLVADRYTGCVFDTDAGKTWDPGQAICREIYGPGWSDDAQFKKDDQLPDSEFPTIAWEHVKRIVEERGILRWKEKQVFEAQEQHDKESGCKRED